MSLIGRSGTPIKYVVTEVRDLNLDLADLNLLSLSYGRIVPKDISSNEGLLPASFDRYSKVRPGDIVLRLTDLQNDQRSLRTGLVKQAGIITSAYLTLRPRPSVDPRYLWYSLYAFDAGKIFYALGGGLRQSMGMEDVGLLRLEIPSLEEQRRIADFLDDQAARIDAAANLRERELSLLEDGRRAQLTELVYRVDGRGAPLGHLVEMSHGRQRSPEHEHGEFMTPYVRSANVADGQLNLADVKEMNFTPSERVRYALEPGDVLVTEAAGSADAIGASARWADEMLAPVCFQNHLIRLRARRGVSDPDYVYWWARAAYASGAMRSHATGVSVLNLGSEALKRMLVPQTELVVQSATARACERTEHSYVTAVSAVRESMRLLNEYKRSLITAAVTGEFDVTTARTGVPA